MCFWCFSPPCAVATKKMRMHANTPLRAWRVPGRLHAHSTAATLAARARLEPEVVREERGVKRGAHEYHAQVGARAEQVPQYDDQEIALDAALVHLVKHLEVPVQSTV